MNLTDRTIEALKLAGWAALVVVVGMFLAWADGTPLLVVLRATGYTLLTLCATVAVLFVFTIWPLLLVGKWIPDWLYNRRHRERD